MHRHRGGCGVRIEGEPHREHEADTASDVAADIVKFCEAGCRTIVFDLIGPYEERIEHTEAIASDVLPLLASYRH